MASKILATWYHTNWFNKPTGPSEGTGHVWPDSEDNRISSNSTHAMAGYIFKIKVPKLLNIVVFA